MSNFFICHSRARKMQRFANGGGDDVALPVQD
jgi:hypothetical protein